MKYPDGQIVKVRDLVWWNEGECVGYVQAVWESEDEYAPLDFQHPHMFVTNHHPFDPTIESGVAHDEAIFEDEGIALLSPEERQHFESVVARAFQAASCNPAQCVYSVLTECVDGKMVGWIVEFCESEFGAVVETVRLPWE